MSEGMPAWVDDFPGAVTVSAKDGTILHLNEAASQVFERQGGAALAGSDLMACHKEASRAIIRALADADLVELSMPIPPELPHFDRG